MPTYELPDEYHEKLKIFIKDFGEEASAVLMRVIDDAVKRVNGSSRAVNGALAQQRKAGEDDYFIQLDPDRADVTFTKLLTASIDGQKLHRPNWNLIRERLHVLAKRRFKSFAEVKRCSMAHIREGRFEGEGFKYLSEADLSIQGVQAKEAWAHALGLARVLDVPLQVEFYWRNKKAAAHPGRYGRLEWKP